MIERLCEARRLRHYSITELVETLRLLSETSLLGLQLLLTELLLRLPLLVELLLLESLLVQVIQALSWRSDLILEIMLRLKSSQLGLDGRRAEAIVLWLSLRC